MQLVKPTNKEKGKDSTRRPPLANAANRMRAELNSSIELNDEQLGERLKQGVMNRLWEHATQRQGMKNACITDEALLTSSDEEEDSPVTPRACLQQFCQQPSQTEHEMGTKECGSGIGAGECEKFYKQYGNSVQYLLVMAIGLKDKKG